MANQADRWYFNKETIRNSPSTRDGVEHAKELGYRQQCANLIQDIGQRLQVNQLVINTAIVYMHRFYMFHSFQKMHRNVMAACFIFLAAKVEEMPRKLEHILKASHRCLNDKETPTLDNKSDEYMQLSADLVNNESVLLQTLGFEVTVDHPNTYVVKCAQLVKASKELAQTAYFLATNSLHLTTFCIQYKPTVVACVCIYVACLWANYVIPETEGKNWYEFIENTTTKKQLDDLSSYFIKILDSSPTRLKKRLTSGGAVVYKDGKVVQKKDEASTSSSTSSHSETSTAKKHEPPVKNTLISHLKAHSHEATPPPSSHRSSHHHTKSNTNTPVNSSKTAEQLKLDRVKQKLTPEQWEEYKRKRMTPEQLEAYKKCKERERQIYMKKKIGAALNATKSAQKTAADPLRKSNNDEASPMKRARIDSSSHHSSNHSSTNHHSSNHHHTLNHHQNHTKQPHHTNHNRLNAATTTTTTQKHSTKPYKSNGNIINSKLQHLPPHPPELNF